MTPPYHRLLLVFVDGLGLAPADGHNPLSELATPALRSLLGGPLTLEQCRLGKDLLLTALDAALGVQGLPQSATGQTALFTGINAAARLGRHVTGLPGPRLRAILEAGNLLQTASRWGLPTAFANAYSPAYLRALEQGRRRPSVTTCALWSSGLRPRSLSELEGGEAVTWDIVRDRFAEHVGGGMPLVSPIVAGRHLATIAAKHRLTVYETFITDMAGHGRLDFTANEALERVDGLLAGLVAARTADTTILLTSDHGNIEDSRDRRHTRNRVPLLVVGRLAERFSDLRSILEVTPRILSCLNGPC